MTERLAGDVTCLRCLMGLEPEGLMKWLKMADTHLRVIIVNQV